jgi:acetylornithine/succinyldiaminopimelate/putrescine aminotransferase
MSLLHFFPLKDLEIISAKNATVKLAGGLTAYDVGGLSHGAAIIGHSHPAVINAVQEQVVNISHSAHLYPSGVRNQFLQQLHALLPDHLSRTFMANSGTEAVEAALKFAAASTGRTQFVAANNGFHGRTLGALSVTQNPAYRGPVGNMAATCDFIPFNDEEALAKIVTKETAAVILEPIQGEGGSIPGTAEYLKLARDLCDDSGSMLIFDEVQTGMGRTGPFLATNVAADIVTLGKGLAGGLPIGLACVTDDLANSLPAGFHGSTYGGNPLVSAAGCAALEVWKTENLGERSKAEGARLRRAIENRKHPAIEFVQGRGLMLTAVLNVPVAPVLTSLEKAGYLALRGGPSGIRLLPPLTTETGTLGGTVDALFSALG